MVVLHFGAKGITAWDFLLGNNHQALQESFIVTTCASFKFFGYCYIYILYSLLFLSMIDIFLGLIMMIPGIRRNSFMALLYKTFLIVFGFYQLVCYLVTIVFMILYFVAMGKTGISFEEFFTSQSQNPVFWLTLVTFFILAIISMVKLMSYKNYSRPQ